MAKQKTQSEKTRLKNLLLLIRDGETLGFSSELLMRYIKEACGLVATINYDRRQQLKQQVTQ